MKERDTLCGPIAVTVTPFTQSGELNEEELRRQTEWLCRKEITGLFPCSSTGEFVRMSHENKKNILRIVAEENKGRKKLIAGACSASAWESILWVQEAKKYGYDACVICPPYYYPINQQEIEDFYNYVADNSEGMGVMLYQVPCFTTGISFETKMRLMQHPNIVGIKDSSADLKLISHLNDCKPKDFLSYTGTDDCLLPALISGCDGSMTALAGIFPEWITAIYQKFGENNIDEARKIQRSLLPLLRLADSLPFPDGYKLLAELRALKVGPLLSSLREEELCKVRQQMQEAWIVLTGGEIDESNDLARL